MPDIERTQAQLLTALFQDGQLDGSINAQDVRDLIVSLGFGAYERDVSVFNDYLFPGLDVSGTGISSPSLVELRDGIKCTAFAGTGGQVIEGFFVIHLQHDIKANSDLTFHIHWTHNNAAPSGDVKWNIDCSTARGYSAGVFPVPSVMTSIQTAGPQYTHHITSDTDMLIVASVEHEPDACIIGRIWRDPSDPADTFADDAFLVHVDVHYEMTREGTLEKNRPFTSGGF